MAHWFPYARVAQACRRDKDPNRRTRTAKLTNRRQSGTPISGSEPWQSLPSLTAAYAPMRHLMSGLPGGAGRAGGGQGAALAPNRVFVRPDHRVSVLVGDSGLAVFDRNLCVDEVAMCHVKVAEPRGASVSLRLARTDSKELPRQLVLTLPEPRIDGVLDDLRNRSRSRWPRGCSGPVERGVVDLGEA